MDDYLKRKLQNPEFRAAYDAEDKRIELVRLFAANLIHEHRNPNRRLRRDRARSVADA